MPIDSLHPQYAARKEEMLDCRTAFEGSRAIKTAGARYLPMLKGQETADYRAYKDRALFFSITGKTVAALVGMAMSRPPIVKASDQLNPYFTERQGAQFLEIASTTLQEVLLMGGYGILVDAPAAGSLLPQLCRYSRESIINWRVDDSGRPTMLVFRECVAQQKSNDEFDFEEVIQYRKLWLDGAGIYHSTVYDEKGALKEAVMTPTVRRATMRHIPFYLINPLGVSMDVVRPPMLDIVDLNISHYRTSADLEHGRHFTGLPTPYVCGAEGGTELHIGSQAAWVLPNADAKVGFLEFTGQGLQSLEKALQEKQGQMASMSARLLDNSKRGSEAEGAVKLRYMSETASLITVVRATEDGLNQVYGEVAEIVGTERPLVQMNKEFMEAKMSASDLTAILKAYIEGAISKETLLHNLRRGDIISPDREDADELAAMIPPAPKRTQQAANED